MNCLIEKLVKSIRFFYDILTSKSNYGKFVVISRSRTGSNLLISLLNNNPKIQTFGEKFQILGNNSCIEIYDQIFPKKSNKVIGFKIFYYHPVDSDDKTIWDVLKNKKNFKIIHLQRKNFLRVYISRLIAGKTNEWETHDEDAKTKLEDKRVHIDLDNLFREYEWTNSQIKIINNNFRDHEMIDVYYEDLINNRDTQMAIIFDFLGVKNTYTHSKLKKQNPEPIRHLILNYQELNDRLIDTEFSWMLNE